MSPTSSSLPRSHQRRKAERPQELLEAALQLFISKGLAATRMEDVAREAGVSKGTLYLYYPSKDELFKAVLRTYLSEVIVEGSAIVDQHQGSSAEVLHQLAKTWWTRVGSAKAAGLIVVVLNEMSTHPDLAQYYANEVVAPTHALLRRVIERGMQRDEFRPLDVDSVVHALIAPIQYLIVYRHCMAACPLNPAPLDPESFIATQIQLLLHGLEKPAKPA